MTYDNTMGASASSMLESRPTEVKNLKTLKSPEEGGTKKEYEDFLDKIQNHVIGLWAHGKDTGYVIGNGQEPTIKEPADITDEEAKPKIKSRIWSFKVDRYVARTNVLE